MTSSNENGDKSIRQQALELWYRGFFLSRDQHLHDARTALREAFMTLRELQEIDFAAWTFLDLVFTYLQEGDITTAKTEFLTLASDEQLHHAWAFQALRTLFYALDQTDIKKKARMLDELFNDLMLYISKHAARHLPEYRLIFWRTREACLSNASN